MSPLPSSASRRRAGEAGTGRGDGAGDAAIGGSEDAGAEGDEGGSVVELDGPARANSRRGAELQAGGIEMGEKTEKL